MAVNEIEEGIEKDPNEVHEMPIEARDFNGGMIFVREFAAMSHEGDHAEDAYTDGDTHLVGFLRKAPTAAAKRATEALSNDQDRLVVHGAELHWLVHGGFSVLIWQGKKPTDGLLPKVIYPLVGSPLAGFLLGLILMFTIYALLARAHPVDLPDAAVLQRGLEFVERADSELRVQLSYGARTDAL